MKLIASELTFLFTHQGKAYAVRYTLDAQAKCWNVVISSPENAPVKNPDWTTKGLATPNKTRAAALLLRGLTED